MEHFHINHEVSEPMKYLVLLVVVLGMAWWMFGRRGKPPLKPPAAPGTPPKQNTGDEDGAELQAMLACAHCGVHLPKSETTADAQGLRYCSDTHRIAGPAGR